MERRDFMRFVHVLVGSADPRSVNGVNKVVHWLATTQVEMGLSSEIWALKPNGAEADHERNYSLRVFRTTKSRFLLTGELRSALEQLSPDTWVQLHSVYIPELTSIARILKKRGIFYGVTTHGGYLSLYFDQSRALRIKKAIFAVLWENWMLRNAAMIHVIGATELDDLERRAPGQKMVMIPNGYNLGQLEASTGPRQESQPLSIMFCGRHEIKQKGLDLLLRGFADYRKQGGTLNLVLISGGKDNAYLRALAQELSVANSVSWPGILPVNELRSTLRGGVAFVHTSRFDVLPTACLEAAALGLPLFMSWETNFAEYILPRNAGWVCRPNVPEKIAEMMFLIERSSPAERLAMGDNARRMIEEELRWDLICEKLAQTASECMGGQHDADRRYAGQSSYSHLSQ
jgi:glycosyltransferase involved in cell wall biosynthesis